MSSVPATFTEKVKALFSKHKINLEVSEPVIEPRVFLASAKLKDGSEIHTTADSFAVGVDCFFKDVDGNESPVPNNTYELEDGTMITITEGLITEMTPGSGEPEDAAALKEEITSLKAALTELQETAQADITALTTERDSLKVKLSEVTTRAEKLGKMVPGKKAPQEETTERKPLGHVDPMKSKIREGIDKFVGNN